MTTQQKQQFVQMLIPILKSYEGDAEDLRTIFNDIFDEALTEIYLELEEV